MNSCPYSLWGWLPKLICWVPAQLTSLPRGCAYPTATAPQGTLAHYGYLLPHKLGPGLQLLRSGGEVMGIAAFSSSQIRMLILPIEKTTSHHSPDFSP